MAIKQPKLYVSFGPVAGEDSELHLSQAFDMLLKDIVRDRAACTQWQHKLLT